MARYPLVFGLRDLIQGEGFLAGVAVNGRALLHEDDGDIWIEGINPGGFSETGASFADAVERFRRTYTSILFDIASDAESFDEFKRDVEVFFHDCASRPKADWEQAVQDVRQGRIKAEWLTRKPADAPVTIEVIQFEHPSSKNNEVEVGTALAA